MFSRWSTLDHAAPPGGSATFGFGPQLCCSPIEEDGNKARARALHFAACMRIVRSAGRIFEDDVTDLQHAAVCNVLRLHK